MTRSASLALLALAALVAGASTALASEPVIWSRPVNVTLTADGMAKAGPDGWNAGASSVQALVSGDGFVEASAGETTTDKVIGLGRNSADQSFEEIDFAIDCVVRTVTHLRQSRS